MQNTEQRKDIFNPVSDNFYPEYIKYIIFTKYLDKFKKLHLKVSKDFT